MKVKAFMKFFQRQPSLIPLFVSVGGCITMAFAFLIRQAVSNPDVEWIKTDEEISNMRVPAGPHKLYSPTYDCTEMREIPLIEFNSYTYNSKSDS